MATPVNASDQPAVYEVNVDVDQSIKTEYLEWLVGHIEKILAFPGFVQCDLSERAPDDLGSNSAADAKANYLITIAYRLKNKAYLDDYLAKHAPKLRAEGLEKFGSKFKASRRVLYPKSVYVRK